MIDDTSMAPAEAPETSAGTGTSGGHMTEAEARRLIREEVSAAIAEALRPAASGPPVPGELRSYYVPEALAYYR